MKLTTNLTDSKRLAMASEKAKRLCKLYHVDLIGLMILSIDIQADLNQHNNNKK